MAVPIQHNSSTDLSLGRPENLAFIFQEFITAVVRLKTGRQEVSSAEAFRSQALQAIKMATQKAINRGYTQEHIQFATFAAVAFLDESILNLRKAIFSEWVRKPLQEELFGRHVAGETFFVNLQHLLGQRDTPELADVLEAYQLCMLLGYLGKYSIASKGDLRALMMQTDEKINRIRKTSGDLSPNWLLPQQETRIVHHDPWLGRIQIAALASLALTVLLFGVYKVFLESGVRELEQLSSPRGRR